MTLHTGHEHETSPLDGVDMCECSWWPRSSATSRPGAAAARRPSRDGSPRDTVPHLASAPSRGLRPARAGRRRDRRAEPADSPRPRGAPATGSCTPHMTCSRAGVLVDGMLLSLAYRVPHAVDRAFQRRRTATRRRGRARSRVAVGSVGARRRTEQQISRAGAAKWRADGTDTVVLFAGFIRPEKRLDVLVESARRLAAGPPARGGGAGPRRLGSLRRPRQEPTRSTSPPDWNSLTCPSSRPRSRRPTGRGAVRAGESERRARRGRASCGRRRWQPTSAEWASSHRAPSPRAMPTT